MHDPPHPGEVLRELYMQPLDLSETETADALGVTRKTLSAIVNARAGVSPDMALRLAKAFGGTAESWLAMQQAYELWQARRSADLSRVRVLAGSAHDLDAETGTPTRERAYGGDAP